MAHQGVLFEIEGVFDTAVFARWIKRHAAKLGLGLTIKPGLRDRLSLRAEGPADLLDALEMACLLGPHDVWVSHIRRDR